MLRVGNILMEGGILGYYCGDVIQKSKIANVIQYCVNCEERGRVINLNFNMVT